MDREKRGEKRGKENKKPVRLWGCGITGGGGGVGHLGPPVHLWPVERDGSIVGAPLEAPTMS